MKRRHFMKAMSAAGTAGLGMGLYAWRIEPHWVEFVHRIMPVKSLPEHLVGKTLVQLSDIHVGPQVDDAFVRAVFRDVQSLKPDIVVATGDFVTYHEQVQQQAAMVYADLPRGRLATIGVWGNHDYGPDWSCREYAGQLERTLKSSGLTLAEIRNLPECHREPLMLRLMLEMSGPEIAEQTGMTEGSVRVNLCRGMKLLRAHLERAQLGAAEQVEPGTRRCWVRRATTRTAAPRPLTGDA
jgi:predicted phosphodiesterase